MAKIRNWIIHSRNRITFVLLTFIILTSSINVYAAIANLKVLQSVHQSKLWLPQNFPKYMHGFAELPQNEWNLRHLRRQIISQTIQGHLSLESGRDIPESRKCTLLRNGFAYTTEPKHGRIVKVMGVFPSKNILSIIEFPPENFDLNPLWIHPYSNICQGPENGVSMKSETAADSKTRVREVIRKYCKTVAWMGTESINHSEYHAGHLIRHAHIKCDHPLNVVPMHPDVNLISYKSVENSIVALQNLGPVHVTIHVEYAGDQDKRVKSLQRSVLYPLKFHITAKIRKKKAMNWSWVTAFNASIDNPSLLEVPAFSQKSRIPSLHKQKNFAR